MKIAVIGTGHVGLISCVSFAAMGHDVVGTDTDTDKIGSLQDGTAPFFEPGLQEMLAEQLGTGRLRFTDRIQDAVAGATVVFLCVGTPPRATGEANLSAVEHAARDAARNVTERAVIVEKSTVPAGTAEKLRKVLRRERPDLDLEVASNPEFLREGKAIADSMAPDRILVGTESAWALDVMRAVYAPLTSTGIRLIETNIATAELSKHACNAFLATKISFANAVARLCELAGADVTAVVQVMGSDPRIGPEFLRAGLGYGGYCFPKDLQAFDRLAADLGYDFGLLREVARINEEAIDAAFDKVSAALWNVDGKRVALFGLAFKPGTDDVRLSPALALAQRLIDAGAHVVGFDPHAAEAAREQIAALELAPTPYEAAAGAHCIVVCTEWDDFGHLDLATLRATMTYPIVVDARNVFSTEQMAAAGFTYYPTGRPALLSDDATRREP
jgi:UDPglucose 6-dehydrogenase